MKRIIALVLVVLIMLPFTGCSANGSSKDTVTATVITNSGEKKQMTLQELRKIASTNSVLFDSEYVGADITVTSTIKEIGGAYGLMSWFDCDAYVKLEANSTGCFFKPITEAYAKTLKVGDTITVSGKIAMASVADLNIYIFKDEISPY